ncbi:hypothetical protein CKAH01_11886 [Colletotrichum kahawae]|uniref:Integral membrane protein n=1 Tax=Colletotrichum kahawae TaxID=34407 RepID=A0AAD9YUS0_COLKA|nr:hypothetical protein CKAH01_11886 [Colletotrichum kahawae]
MFFMAVLFVCLITAIVPTAYFNWEAPGGYAPTASVPASNTRCFFSRKTAQAVWDSRVCPTPGDETHELPDGYHCVKQHLPLSTTTAYEGSIFSVTLLSTGFVLRFFKMSRTLSETANNGVCKTTSQWTMICLTTMLFWLLLASIWGSIRLYLARRSATVEGSENEWQFGQILPVFLLLGPLLAVIIPVIEMRTGGARSKLCGEDPKGIEQVLELIKERRNGRQYTRETREHRKADTDRIPTHET